MKNGFLAKLFLLSGLCFLLLQKVLDAHKEVLANNGPVAWVAPHGVAFAQVAAPAQPTEVAPGDELSTSPGADAGTGSVRSWKDVFRKFGGALFWAVWGLAEIVVRITPSERDNSIVNWIKGVLDQFFPNRKESGGEHD